MSCCSWSVKTLLMATVDHREYGRVDRVARRRSLLDRPTIGHYEVIEKIGEGGMGAVYKARDIHLDRSVALKILPGESVANSERKRRFALEAKAASALNHPNIITIYDIDVADGVDFIAMEYVAGHTLADVIPPDGMEPARAIQFGAQIADALATAHQSGIVHRDSKPSNIMVNEQGRVKLLDFGLAKLIEPVCGEGAATQTAAAQTREGANTLNVMGSEPPVWNSTSPEVKYQSNTSATPSLGSAM